MRAVRLVILVLLATRVAHAQPAASGPPSKTLERAIKLYDKQDFYSASVELQKVLDGETGDDTGNKQRAEFFMAKSLRQMKYYAASLAILDKIIAAGGAHPYYVPTLKWVVSLLEQPPGLASQRFVLRSYDPNAASDPSIDGTSRSAFRYHFGRVLADQNRLSEAEESLRAARDGLEARAALELAKLAFRSQRIDDGVAAIRVAAADPAIADEAIRVLATWTRLLHVPRQGRDALGAFAANSQLAALEYSRLQLPQPELAGVSNETFDALAITTSCGTVARRSNGVPELRGNVNELRTLVDHLLAYDDNAEAYVAVEKAMERSPVLRLALLDADAREVRGWVGELAVELRALEHADKAWQTTQIAAMVLQELTVQQAVAQADTGKRYRFRLQSLQRDLATLWQVFEHAPEISIGPRGTIAVGNGLCGSLLAVPPGQIAGPGQPVGVPPVRGNGCAGCATSGDAGGLLLVLALVFVRRRRIAA